MISKLLGRIFYPRFRDESYFTGTIVRYIFWQRILGNNRGAWWPVHHTSRILAPENVENGTKAPGSACGCHIDGRNGIRFGKNVLVGPHVSIISCNHDINDYSKYVPSAPIVIGDDCWIATGAIILPGVCLGPHTVVGAGSVVTHSFPEGNQFIAGNPARVIRALAPYQNV